MNLPPLHANLSFGVYADGSEPRGRGNVYHTCAGRFLFPHTRPPPSTVGVWGRCCVVCPLKRHEGVRSLLGCHTQSLHEMRRMFVGVEGLERAFVIQPSLHNLNGASAVRVGL